MAGQPCSAHLVAALCFFHAALQVAGQALHLAGQCRNLRIARVCCWCFKSSSKAAACFLAAAPLSPLPYAGIHGFKVLHERARACHPAAWPSRSSNAARALRYRSCSLAGEPRAANGSPRQGDCGRLGIKRNSKELLHSCMHMCTSIHGLDRAHRANQGDWRPRARPQDVVRRLIRLKRPTNDVNTA